MIIGNKKPAVDMAMIRTPEIVFSSALTKRYIPQISDTSDGKKPITNKLITSPIIEIKRTIRVICMKVPLIFCAYSTKLSLNQMSILVYKKLYNTIYCS